MLVMTAVQGPVPAILPMVPVVLIVATATEPNSIFLSSTVNVLELSVVVVPLMVKLPPITKLPGTVSPVELIVNTVLITLGAVPDPAGGAALNRIFPPPPLPVPLPASIIVSAPTIFVPTAAPALNVATPPVDPAVASPPLNVAVPPAPLVTPPAPPLNTAVAPAAVTPTAPGVTVRLLPTCVLIVCAVLAAPTV